MKRMMALCLAAVMLMGMLCGCEEQPLTRETFAMDTACSISLYDGKSEELLDACVALLSAREALWSRTVPDSDVAKLNTANGAPVAVGSDTMTLLQTALFYAAVTDGAFDITAATLSDLWKQAQTDGVAPSAEAIAEALRTVGSDKVTVGMDAVTLAPGVSIDLGGIAKGQAADDLAALLKTGDCTGALIDLGGNMFAMGTKPNGKPFRIGIADPRDPNAVIAMVEVSDRAVVTSGSYQRGYQIGENTYSHIMDPMSGVPVENDLLSVTVIAPLAVDADVLSTACFVMGYDKATAFLQSFEDVEAVFVRADGSVVATDGAPLV